MSSKPSILLIEDDELLAQAILDSLCIAGFEVELFHEPSAALHCLSERSFSLVLSDICLDYMSGVDCLQRIKKEYPGLPVILMTAYGDIAQAVLAMKIGAADYITKPFDVEAVMRLIKHHALLPRQKIEADPYLTQSLCMRACVTAAKKVAKTEVTVLLTGESGVGKEVLARYIHDHSSRHGEKFIAVNCAAIPESLLEATLFGYEKGAFTGAQLAQAGKFEQAGSGTLLLDEISEMPLSLQAKLLRVIQEREVERLGSSKVIPLKMRIIATSNRKLKEYVAQGHFRADLYYRLSVFPIEVPALRDRREDILALAERFLQKFSQYKKFSLSEAARKKILDYSWPGNVRELENVIQRAVILTSSECITEHHIDIEEDTLPLSVQKYVSDSGMSPSVKDMERDHILEILKSVGGSRKKAVEILGISDRTLRYKMAKYREEGYVLD